MSSSPEHARLLRLATRASVAVASLLIVTKAIAWWLSGSISMLAGLTDSLLDGVNDGFLVVTTRAPSVVFLPSSVPCGPRSTSTRSTSTMSSSAPCGRAM